MKKRKLIASLLLICMLLTTLPFSILVAADDSARNGPFETLEEAVGDRTLMPNREFVEGAEEHWGDEGPWNLFDGDLETKYGAGGAMLPFWATWRYPEAFIADRFLFATANDNEAHPRRMDDGWRLYGSNDNSNWTVLYTGRGEDYENYNFMWFFVDLPDNNTAYRYYRIWSDFGFDSDGIQLSEVELTGRAPAPEPEPAAAAEAEAEAAPEAPAPAVVAPTPAPRTADPITLIAIGAVVSAAGIVIAKKRK